MLRDAGIDAASGTVNDEPSCGTGWVCEAAANKFVYVEMDPISTQPSYAMPTISHNPVGSGPSDCGVSRTVKCDDIPIIKAALAALECNGAFPCQNIDTSKVYFTGSSKGAAVPQGRDV